MKISIKKISFIIILSFIAGGIITALMERNSWLYGWFISSILLGVSFAVLYFLWKKAGSAKMLGWMIAVAFFLRLGLGVGLMTALPVIGYDTEQQKAGYVFFDAFRRDFQAMDITSSNKPIISVFSKQYATDQYGGYLGLSVFTYRVLSNGDFRPHLMLIFSALASAIGVPFIWMILKRIGDGRWQKFAGWWYVLYPQAVLMGASQMREPYLITFVTIVFWAALEWQHTGIKPIWPWLLASLAGMLVFSPGVAVTSIVIIAGWLWIDRSKKDVPLWVFLVGFMVLVIGIIALAYGLARQDHFVKDSPLQIIFNWLKNAAAWDMSVTHGASGQIQFQLKSLPDWMAMPFILLYGILQPVLPATIMDPAAWIWRLLSTWLALGWYLLIPVLAYGAISVFFERETRIRNKMLWLGLVIWSWILFCSLRAGGDQWDNPRYRTILLVFIVIFAAWAWEQAKHHRFVWLKRIVLMEGAFLVFFLQWYAARYYQVFGKLPFFTMILIIFGLFLLIGIGGLISDRNSKKQIRG
jgi:hypothetical protein